MVVMAIKSYYVLSRHFRDLPEQSIAYTIIISGGNINIFFPTRDNKICTIPPDESD